MKIPLNESARGTADATGNARVLIGPKTYGIKWDINNIAVTSTSTTESECTMYRNVQTDTALIDGTPNGNGDVSPTSGLILLSGENLLFVWTGASVGAICTVTITGVLDTGR